MLRLSLKNFRYAGLATVLVLWTFLGVGMLRAHLGFLDTRPLSYLGTNPESNWLFSAGLIVGALAMITFGFYLMKTYKLNHWFIVTVLMGQLGQIIAGVVPYGGTSKRLHTIAAFVLAFSIPIMMWLFAKQSTSEHRLARRFVIAEIIAFSAGIGWFIFTKNAAPLSQIVVALVYHAWLVSLSVGLL